MVESDVGLDMNFYLGADYTSRKQPVKNYSSQNRYRLLTTIIFIGNI